MPCAFSESMKVKKKNGHAGVTDSTQKGFIGQSGREAIGKLKGQIQVGFLQEAASKVAQGGFYWLS